MLVLKKLLTVLLLPPLLPLLLIAVGLLLTRRHRRVGKMATWSGLVFAVLLSLPFAVNLITSPLESVPVLSAADLRRAQAIVILGAGQRRHAPEYGGAALNRLALERLRYGARLARTSGLPVLVSGGAASGDVAEALLMAASLREDFAIEPRWQENRSLDTADNARYTAMMLQPINIRRIALVTHAAHMRRARAEFEAMGFQVLPAPLGFLSDPSAEVSILDALPGATAAYSGWYAMHEWVGLLAQKLRMAAP